MNKSRILIFIYILLLTGCGDYKKDNLPAQTQNPLSVQYYKKAKAFQNQYVNDSAYHYLQKSEKIALQNNDSLLLSKIFLSKAEIDFRNSDLPTSENYCVKAIQYTPKNNQAAKAYIYNLLGHIATLKENYDTAKEYYKKAYENYKKANDSLKGYLIYHNNMTYLNYENENYPEALKHIDSVLAVKNLKKNHTDRYAWTINDKAQILLKLKKPDKAKKLLDEAYIIFDSTANVPKMTINSLNYATYYYQTGQMDKAKQKALEALHMAKKTQIANHQLETYKKLAQIDSVNARYYLTRHMEITDSIEVEQEKVKEQTARIRYEDRNKIIEIEKQKQIIEQNKIRTYWILSLLAVVLLALLIFSKQYRKIKKQNVTITRQNVKLNEKNKLIETIYQEMHHRIKNNFDIINYVFIDKFISKVNNPLYVEKLRDLQNKIASMKELHLLLKDSEPTLSVPLSEYIDKVINHTNLSFGDKSIDFQLDIPDNINILFKQAAPVGLIINEFITNSYKYAFEHVLHPVIKISARDLGDKIELIIQDNGKGLPEDFSVLTAKTQGLRMIISLLRQLKADFTHMNENGLKFIITIPKSYPKKN